MLLRNLEATWELMALYRIYLQKRDDTFRIWIRSRRGYGCIHSRGAEEVNEDGSMTVTTDPDDYQSVLKEISLSLI